MTNTLVRRWTVANLSTVYVRLGLKKDFAWSPKFTDKLAITLAQIRGIEWQYWNEAAIFKILHLADESTYLHVYIAIPPFADCILTGKFGYFTLKFHWFQFRLHAKIRNIFAKNRIIPSWKIELFEEMSQPWNAVMRLFVKRQIWGSSAQLGNSVFNVFIQEGATKWGDCGSLIFWILRQDWGNLFLSYVNKISWQIWARKQRTTHIPRKA